MSIAIIAASALATAIGMWAASTRDPHFGVLGRDIDKVTEQRFAGPPAEEILACSNAQSRTKRFRTMFSVVADTRGRKDSTQDRGWAPRDLSSVRFTSAGEILVVDSSARTVWKFSADLRRRAPIPGISQSIGSDGLRRARDFEQRPGLSLVTHRGLLLLGVGVPFRHVPPDTLQVTDQAPWSGDTIVVSWVPRGGAVFKSHGLGIVGLVNLHTGAIVRLLRAPSDSLSVRRALHPYQDEARLERAGRWLAVWYPIGGVVDLYRDGQYRASAATCMSPAFRRNYEQSDLGPTIRLIEQELLSDVSLSPNGDIVAIEALADAARRRHWLQFDSLGRKLADFVLDGQGRTLPGLIKIAADRRSIAGVSPSSGAVSLLGIDR